MMTIEILCNFLAIYTRIEYRYSNKIHASIYPNTSIYRAQRVKNQEIVGKYRGKYKGYNVLSSLQ